MSEKIEKVRIYNKGKNEIQTTQGVLRGERYLDVTPSLAKILVNGYKNILYAESMGKDSVPSGPGKAALQKKENELNEREKRIKEAEERLGIENPQEPELPEPPEIPTDNKDQEPTVGVPQENPQEPDEKAGKKRGRPRK